MAQHEADTAYGIGSEKKGALTRTLIHQQGAVASRKVRRYLVGAGAAIFVLAAATWYLAGRGTTEHYLLAPGQGHPHFAAVLPAPGSKQHALWLGTHSGLYIKAIGQGSREGWRQIGPPLQSTDVMAIGAASSLRSVSGSGSPIYAAGHKIGVQKSDDGGATWHQIMQGAPIRDAHALAVDPQDGDRLFVWAEGAGLLQSSNGGATWETSEGEKTLKSPVQVTALAISHPATAPPTLYAATNLGLFASSDGGANWVATGGQATDQPLYAVLAGSGGGDELYAGTATGLLYSDDSGKRWRRTGNGADIGGVGGIALDVAVTGGRLLVVNGANQLLASDDRGETWQPVP